MTQTMTADPAVTKAILNTPTNSREPVRLALRKLWSDHVFWTREYIIAATKGAAVADTAQAALGAVPMGDADATAARLLRNQEEIGQAIVPGDLVLQPEVSVCGTGVWNDVQTCRSYAFRLRT